MAPIERTPAGPRGPAPPPAITFLVSGRIERSGIAELCARVRALVTCDGPGLLLCDVGTITDPDAATVEALARIRLIAKRLGWELRLAHECRELRELLELMGLSDVLPASG